MWSVLHGFLCQKHQVLLAKFYHTTSSNLKWAVARKLKHQVKSRTSRIKHVKIWKNMTIYDLAKSMKRDVEYLENVLKPTFKDCMTPVIGTIQNISSIKNLLEEEKIPYSEVLHPTKKHTLEETLKEIPVVKSSNVNVNNLVERPPVVTIMGHVDHGKTTLLDALRNSDIVSGEFGGITQHIGAFSVCVKPGCRVTFIDTPGHAAFAAMRNRGSNVTDIVVLVVAVDDGVMEQTIESIKMAKNAGVRIIVAVNKIDKGIQDMESIKRQLLEEGIQIEDMGGDVQFIPISALKKINLHLLIDAILLEADLLNLRGDPTANAEGVVIESSKSSKGHIATVLVKQGTLRQKTVLVAGTALARVRLIFDENGQQLSEASLSQPAQVVGWRQVPSAGEKFFEVKSEKYGEKYIKEVKKTISKTKESAEYEIIQRKAVEQAAEFIKAKKDVLMWRETGNVERLKEFYRNRRNFNAEVDEKTKLNIIVKGDVDGSVDAILDIIETYTHNDECELNVVHHGVGNVVSSDIELAATFDATIYCFNLDYPQDLKSKILSSNIKIKFNNVIYNLINDLKEEITSIMPLKTVENVIGVAEVVQNFNIREKRRNVPTAGSLCLSGEIKKNECIRVMRGNEVLYEGKIKSLKYHKTEVDTIKNGSHCGIMLEGMDIPFHPKDKIICYKVDKVKVKTSWDPGF